MLSKCLDHVTPAQVMGQILCGHLVESSHPFFEPRMVGVRVLDVVDAGQYSNSLTETHRPVGHAYLSGRQGNGVFPSSTGTEDRIPGQEGFQDYFDLRMVILRKDRISGRARPVTNHQKVVISSLTYWPRILRLICRYLQAGIMGHGVVVERSAGTPHGSPALPAPNVLLDEVDKDLERRGHRFVRYADDSNIYVRSQRTGERVLQSLRGLYAKFHLKVNEAKTTVGSVFCRKFLGYCLRRGAGTVVKRGVAPKAIATFKQRIREITRRSGGRSLTQVAEQLRLYLPGWNAYFHLPQTSQTFNDLDSWIRHRLRAVQLKHWRRGRTV